MKLRRTVAWRIVAATLWIFSIVCLMKAVGDGVTAEKSLYNPHLTEIDRAAIQHWNNIADDWGWAGWSLQAIAAIVLAAGIDSKRVTRRVFVSLGVMVALDGVLLLLVTFISSFG